MYDFSTHRRVQQTRRVEPADVIILEGILVLHVPELRSKLNMKIYVDTGERRAGWREWNMGWVWGSTEAAGE